MLPTKLFKLWFLKHWECIGLSPCRENQNEMILSWKDMWMSSLSNKLSISYIKTKHKALRFVVIRKHCQLGLKNKREYKVEEGCWTPKYFLLTESDNFANVCHYMKPYLKIVFIKYTITCICEYDCCHVKYKY